jgi:Transposase DDE domain group 1
MQAFHTRAAVAARFDDPNVVSHAGLVPVLRLAHDAGLGELADRVVRLGDSRGANAGAKIGSIVAGMVCGADSIDDLEVIRHGGLPRLFGAIRAPSTLGTFLRHFSYGHVRQLDVVSAELLVGLKQQCLDLLPGIDQLAFVDIDAKITEVYGPGKQGAAFGYTKKRGLNFLLVTLSTLLSPHPVVVATRLRGGNADSRRGAASLLTQAITLARRCGATGTIIVRADSAFFTGPIVAAIRAAGARFSITAPHNPAVGTAIAGIDEQAWTPITYPRAIYDQDSKTWISAAEIAETTLTAFINVTDNPGRQVTARLLVRRVRIGTNTTDQGELFAVYRYHAVFTNSRFDLPTSEAQHRDHAIIEQVLADLNDSALAHFPSGRLAANAAWLALAALTHNLLRAAGTLASVFHARARTSTIRRQLIAVAARSSRSARRVQLHLPVNWPWQTAWLGLFTATHTTPAATV